MFDKKIKIALVLSFGLSIVACTDYLDEFQSEYNDAFMVIDNPSSSEDALSSEEGKSSGKKTSSSSEEDDSGKSSGNSSSSAKSGNNLFDDIKCESGDLWCKDSYGLRLATYFKDGKNKSGYWYDYSDKDIGGKSKIIWPVERGSDELDKKFVQYCQGICGTVEIHSGYEYPFAGVGFNIAESAKGSDTPVSVDVSDWGGICVTYLSEIEIKLQQSLGSNLDSALLDFDVPVKKLSKTSSPKEVCLAWTDFNQEGWGGKEKMTGLEVARKLVSLNFKLEGRDGTLADFNIIRLRKNPDGIPSSSVVQSSSSEVLSSSSSKELHSSSSKVQSSSSSTEQSSSSKTIVSDSLGLCYPSDDTIMVGDTIVWYYYGRDIEGEDSYFLKDAGVGGSPRTTFDWAFDGGTPATGRNSSVIDHVNPVATSQRIAYSSAGPKTATVTVTSQNYVGTLTCSDLNVYAPSSSSVVPSSSSEESEVDACNDEMPTAAGEVHTVSGVNASAVTGRVMDTPWHYVVFQSGSGVGHMKYYDNGMFETQWNDLMEFSASMGLDYGSSSGVDASTKTYTADYSYKRTGSAQFSYIGIHGWTKDPDVEYFIIDDWFGGQIKSDLGDKFDEISVDGDTYSIYANARRGPTPTGNGPYLRIFSVRSTSRMCGHINISAHFKKWNELFYGQNYTFTDGGGELSLSLKFGKLTGVSLYHEVYGNGTAISGSVKYSYFDIKESD